MNIPSDLRALARQVAKSELEECEDLGIRQSAGHIGEVILQAVWRALHPDPDAPAAGTQSIELPAPDAWIASGYPGAGLDLLNALISESRTIPFAWLTRDGVPVAAVIPAADVHEPGTCCCSNCPWNGIHVAGHERTQNLV